MLLTHYTAGAVIDQEGKLRVVAPVAFNNAMRQFQRGTVTVQVDVSGKKRSTQANRYYWGVVLAIISDHTGYEPDELHEYFKKRFNPLTFTLAGDEDVIGGPTHSMTSKQFTEFVDRVRRFAETDLGLTLPEPERQEGS